MFSVKGDKAKGSARSIPSFHLYKALEQCTDLFIGFGGHSQAAGISLNPDNIPAFRERINSIVKNTIDIQDMTPSIEIDAGVDLSEVNFKLIKELALLEPFGKANQKPIFGAKELKIEAPKIVGKNHLKMKMKQKSVSVDTIGFRMGDLLGKLDDFYMADAAFMPCINEWNGNKYIQLNLKALRPSI